jgi:flagellar hook assembly protein FlgD
MVEIWHGVSIQVYDIKGKLVETLMDEQMRPGQHTVKWNATGFSSGVYFLKMEAGNFSQVEKLMLIK